MKQTAFLAGIITVIVLAACSRDYDKEIVGKWYAGKASLESDIYVTMRGDGTFTAELTNLDIKPVNATYTLENNRLVMKFSQHTMNYKIVKLDKDVLVMDSKYAKVTWKRLK